MMSQTEVLLLATSSLQVPPNSEYQSTVQSSGTLRLRGENDTAPSDTGNSGCHIRWNIDVINNEGVGKRNSKGECVRAYIQR